MASHSVEQKVLDLLHWLDSLWDSDQPVSLEELHKHFASNIQFYLNHQLIADGITAYQERINALKKMFKIIQIVFPPIDLVAQGNRAAVNWSETFIHADGSSGTMANAAFFHFDQNGKICQFSDLFHIHKK